MNFTTMAAGGPLPVDHIPLDNVRICRAILLAKHTEHRLVQTYHVQYIAPFASHMEGQVMTCPTSSAPSAPKETYIRFVLNDGVVPLTGIAHCATPNKDGLCRLDDFVAGMKQRIEEVDFLYDCFADYPVPYPDLLTNGREKL